MKAPMLGDPLSPVHFLERAGTLFGGRRVVEAGGGGRRVTDWAAVHQGAARLRGALAGLGIGRGDRVATLAWNDLRHLELYFAVPGAGAVLLTVNVRLAPGQVAAILEDAEPVAVFAAPEFVSLVDEALHGTSFVRHRVVLGPEAAPGWVAYAPLRDGGEPGPVRRVPEDEAAGLCYTSGTTGAPKGVLYSHRAIALHTMAISLPDCFGLGEPDVILPAVPMFHANAWGLPYAAAMTGAGLVLPGARPGPDLLAELLVGESVTFAAGVPTIWMGVLDALRQQNRGPLPSLRIHSGGAPTPAALIDAYRAEFDVEIVTGWGMTELTPVGMVAHPRRWMRDDPEAAARARTSQGTPLPFIDARIVDEGGRPVPHDGVTPGELEVRGPWVTAGYFRGASPESFRDGWLRTGDVATIDAEGYTRLVDRTKDLIRSGGEWIPSVALEHALMEHPAVQEAAVVARPDERWGERPVACVVPRGEGGLDGPGLLETLRDRFPSWWVPDAVVFVDAIPRTATGKFDKKALRARVAGSTGSPPPP